MCCTKLNSLTLNVTLDTNLHVRGVSTLASALNSGKSAFRIWRSDRRCLKSFICLIKSARHARRDFTFVGLKAYADDLKLFARVANKSDFSGLSISTYRLQSVRLFTSERKPWSLSLASGERSSRAREPPVTSAYSRTRKCFSENMAPRS